MHNLQTGDNWYTYLSVDTEERYKGGITIGFEYLAGTFPAVCGEDVDYMNLNSDFIKIPKRRGHVSF